MTLIYPPPNIRAAVDKTAEFVARNGPQFEEKIRSTDVTGKKFRFLDAEDPYHDYYQHMIHEFRTGRGKPNRQDSDGKGPQETKTNIQEDEVSIQKSRITHIPVGNGDFQLELGNLGELDWEVVKLLAQFTAAHGDNFVERLRETEKGASSSLAFAFEDGGPSSSGAHTLFRQVTEHYRQIMNNDPRILDFLSLPRKDRRRHMVEYIRNRAQVLYEQRQNAKEEKAAASRSDRNEPDVPALGDGTIDWNDYEIVATIAFDDTDDVDLLPPYNSVGDLPPVTLVAIKDREVLPGTIHFSATALQDVPEGAEIKPDDRGTRIVADYDPKTAKESSLKDTKTLVRCPNCGHAVAKSELEEHLRIELLDPRWAEQQARAKANREVGGDVLASGDHIAENLRNLASRKRDVMDAGDSEPTVPPKPAVVLWDGRKGTARQAKEMARQIAKRKHQEEETTPMWPQRDGSEDKRQKTTLEAAKNETSGQMIAKGLTPEAHWLELHPGPFVVSLVMPNLSEDDKRGWQCKGQTIKSTFAGTDTFAKVKDVIFAETHMPHTKQKIQVNGVFTKDAQSLAAVNVKEDTVMSVTVKERGGRKK
eukprot:Clim_evm147s147 gene=Clim_evmTU147s147